VLKPTVYIPFVNRPDLLAAAIKSLGKYGDRVVIIDNSVDGRTFWELPKLGVQLEPCGWGRGPRGGVVRLFSPCVPLSFTQSQNLMIGWHRVAIADHDYDEEQNGVYFWLHVDGTASEAAYEALLKKVEELEAAGTKWGAVLTRYDVFSAVNAGAANAVGGYDNVFQSYTSDKDFYRRLKLAGYWVGGIGHMDVKHLRSQTLKSDPLLALKSKLTGQARRDYYIAKWGGKPGEEKYTKPFNQ